MKRILVRILCDQLLPAELRRCPLSHVILGGRLVEIVRRVRLVELYVPIKLVEDLLVLLG